MFELLFFAAGVLSVGFFKSIVAFILISIFLSLIIIVNIKKISIKKIIILVLAFMLGVSCFLLRYYKTEKEYGSIENHGEYTVTVISEVESTDDNIKFTGRIKELDNKKAIILIESDNLIEYHDVLKVEGKLQSIANKGYSFGFDNKAYYYSQNIYLKLTQDGKLEKCEKITNIFTYIHKFKEKIKYILGMNFSYESGNFLNSILLGKSGNGNKEINNALRKTGISHIVVVSGMHFAIINMFIIFLLRRMGIKRKTTSLISIFTSFMLAMFIGFTPSVTRAFVMITMLNIADLINRERETDIHLILLTAVMIMIVNPFVVGNSGFILSYCAVTGIVLFNRKIYEFIKFPNGYIKEIIAVSLSSNMITFPLLIYLFRGYPLLFIVTNLVMNLLLPLLMLLGIIVIIISFISMKTGSFIGIPLDYMIKGIIGFIMKISDIPWSYHKTGGIESYYIILFYIALLIMIKFRKHLIKYGIPAIILTYFTLGMFIPVGSYVSGIGEVYYFCGKDSGKVLITYKGESVFIDLSLGNSINYKDLIDSKCRGKIDTVILGDMGNVNKAAENGLAGESIYYPKVNSQSEYTKDYISDSFNHSYRVDDRITVKTDKMVLTLKMGKSYNISEVTVKIKDEYITVTSDFDTDFTDNVNYIVTDAMRQKYNEPNILNCLDKEIERKFI